MRAVPSRRLPMSATSPSTLIREASHMPVPWVDLIDLVTDIAWKAAVVGSIWRTRWSENLRRFVMAHMYALAALLWRRDPEYARALRSSALQCFGPTEPSGSAGPEPP